MYTACRQRTESRIGSAVNNRPAFILGKRPIAIEIIESIVRVPFSVTLARNSAGVTGGSGEHINSSSMACETASTSRDWSQTANRIPLDRERAVTTVEKSGDRRIESGQWASELSNRGRRRGWWRALRTISPHFLNQAGRSCQYRQDYKRRGCQ